MKILLMGNPNVGKSTLFNRLTGANVMESNYPGTTVDYTKGYMRMGNEDIEVVDVPGTFSLEPKDKAEEVAVKMLEENRGAIVISVIDSSKIERGLYLTFEIIERGYPLLLALNMWDIAESKNIYIDVKKLQEILEVPVLPIMAVSGRGIKELVLRIEEAKSTEIDKILEKEAK
ncbi:MAG: hypothetical protein DRP76_01690 [Candidatus Omnitrophota bacterium]|nr:MAG: hypothetical protein DRP76_01690 [Candidatus Omnitrophota bacterium]